jgi:hypothetical protein
VYGELVFDGGRQGGANRARMDESKTMEVDMSRSVTMLLTASVWIAAACGTAAAQPGRFDVLPDTSDLSSCGVGRVVGLRLGRHALVRSESRPNARVNGQLNRGEYVLVCNEDRDEQDRRWYGVVYSRPGNACRTGLPRRALSFNRSCRSGWVRRQRIELLTG